MDVVRLRTLTEKSVLGFGKYSDYRVGDLLGLNKTVYLRWVYYHMSMISFTDDILKQIYIMDEGIILKPGKDADMYNKVNERLWNSRKRESFYHKEHAKKRNKKKNYSNECLRRQENRKSVLQAKNHGR